MQYQTLYLNEPKKSMNAGKKTALVLGSVLLGCAGIAGVAYQAPTESAVQLWGDLSDNHREFMSFISRHNKMYKTFEEMETRF